jgi:hypothetical protein
MQHFQKSLIASGICMLVSVGAHADTTDTAASIKALMTPEQYQAAGLDKLSAAEREALYHWLQQYAGKPAVQVLATPTGAHPAATPATASTAQPVTNATAPENPQEPAAPATAPITTQSVVGAAAVAPLPVTTSQTSNEVPAATAALEKNFGLPEPVDELEAAYQLQASVKEPFRGWSGKTVFYLDNGQIWKQRISGRHTYTGDDNRVVISQNQMGFYEMRLLAVDRAVGVKRLK